MLQPSKEGGAFSKPLTLTELQNSLDGQVGVQRQTDRTAEAALREGERQKLVSGLLPSILAAEAKRRNLAPDFKFGTGEELTDFLTTVGRNVRNTEQGFLQMQQQGQAAGLAAELPQIQARQEAQEANRLKLEAEEKAKRVRVPRVRRV